MFWRAHQDTSNMCSSFWKDTMFQEMKHFFICNILPQSKKKTSIAPHKDFHKGAKGSS